MNEIEKIKIVPDLELNCILFQDDKVPQIRIKNPTRRTSKLFTAYSVILKLYLGGTV